MYDVARIAVIAACRSERSMWPGYIREGREVAPVVYQRGNDVEKQLPGLLDSVVHAAVDDAIRVGLEETVSRGFGGATPVRNRRGALRCSPGHGRGPRCYSRDGAGSASHPGPRAVTRMKLRNLRGRIRRENTHRPRADGAIMAQRDQLSAGLDRVRVKPRAWIGIVVIIGFLVVLGLVARAFRALIDVPPNTAMREFVTGLAPGNRAYPVSHHHRLASCQREPRGGDAGRLPAGPFPRAHITN